MRQIVLRLIPGFAFRAAWRLQFQLPFLKKLINLVGQALVAEEGVIPRGMGKGLRFNGRGCNPGYLAGTSELLELEVLVRNCCLGGIVYDVGANCGYHAIIATRAVGPKGRVYAFEPMPMLAARIRDNAARNSFDNLRVIETAVSDIDGEISFGVVGPLSVINGMAMVGHPDTVDTVTVSSIRLDAFCVDHNRPDLLLIDVEGSEIKVLEGGLQMISQHRPVIMVEVHWLGQTFIDFFNQALRPLGYSAATYQGGPLCPETVRYHALLVPNDV
jgi:FkbM family methyltransferase